MNPHVFVMPDPGYVKEIPCAARKILLYLGAVCERGPCRLSNQDIAAKTGVCLRSVKSGLHWLQANKHIEMLGERNRDGAVYTVPDSRGRVFVPAVFLSKLKDFTATDVLAVFALSKYFNRKASDCYPGQARLAKNTGVCEQEIRESIRRLEALNLIETVAARPRIEKRKTNTYLATKCDKSLVLEGLTKIGEPGRGVQETRGRGCKKPSVNGCKKPAVGGARNPLQTITTKQEVKIEQEREFNFRAHAAGGGGISRRGETEKRDDRRSDLDIRATYTCRQGVLESIFEAFNKALAAAGFPEQKLVSKSRGSLFEIYERCGKDVELAKALVAWSVGCWAAVRAKYTVARDYDTPRIHSIGFLADQFLPVMAVGKTLDGGDYRGVRRCDAYRSMDPNKPMQETIDEQKKSWILSLRAGVSDE